MKLLPHLVTAPATDATTALQPSYHAGLVALSFALAAFAGYETLRLIGHLRTTAQPRRQRWLIATAALVFGAGVWAMHFTAMLAASLPVLVSYDPGLTLLSLFIPVLVSGLGFYWIRLPEIGFSRLSSSGVVTGLGIALMHYLGMAAMRAPVSMSYRRDLFLASIAIGVLAATLAFWFAKYFSDESRAEPSGPVAFGTSVLMAAAIAGMHYTGMAATILVERADVVTDHSLVLDPHIMAGAIALVLIVLVVCAHVATSPRQHTGAGSRLAMLPLLTVAVAATSVALAVVMLYDAAIRSERDGLHAKLASSAALIDAVAAFDARFSADDVAGGAREATLGQLRDAHRRFPGFGASGELLLTTTTAAGPAYLVPRRFNATTDRIDRLLSLSLGATAGTTITPDYRGVSVLAAYRPLPSLGLGMIVKLDMAELRRPFVTAGLLAGGATLLLTLVGFGLYRRWAAPVARELDEKTRLEAELEFARAVQLGLLPEHAPRLADLNCAARTVPARYVSGDFYDFVTLEGDRLGIVIGDVAGKGVSAALLMARMLSDLRYALGRGEDPAAVLAHANTAVLNNASQGMFVTCLCLIVDPRSGEASAANAGHLSLLRRGADGATESVTEASGPPLGVIADPVYANSRLRLSPGDLVLGYTDGIVEAKSDGGEEFGLARLRSSLALATGDAEFAVDALHEVLARFADSAIQHDDLTLLALGFRSADP